MQIDLSIIPDAELAPWKIDTIVKDTTGIPNFTELKAGRRVPIGEYRRLMRGGTIVMSNTPDELRDLLIFQMKIQNPDVRHVLINGLGLGIAAIMACEQPHIESVTVVEISPEVLRLVGLFLHDKYAPKLYLKQADAFEYKPKQKYDVVWHDIWDNICTDNLPEMHKLHRKYGRKTKWQGSWCRSLCEYRAKQDKYW